MTRLIPRVPNRSCVNTLHNCVASSVNLVAVLPQLVVHVIELLERALASSAVQYKMERSG